MARQKTNYNRVKKKPDQEILMKVQEKEKSVRIRSGPGISYSHVDGKNLGKGVFEIVEISEGPGSKSGWGRLLNGDGWVGLDFVEVV